MRRLRTFLFYILLSLFLLAADSAFFPAIGGIYEHLNLTLIVCLYLTTVVRSDIALSFWTVMTTVKALTFSAMFLIPLGTGILVILALNRLIERFFTNRSYYVIVFLCLTGWIVYHSVYLFLLLLQSWMRPEAVVPVVTKTTVTDILVLLIPVGVLVSSAYLFTSYLSRRFRSYFILADH